jgi:hypothetical protein
MSSNLTHKSVHRLAVPIGQNVILFWIPLSVAGDCLTT